MDYRMVPQLSALSLALCHEVLEGGGYHQIRKKKLPLLLTPFAIHCLTKATAFVPQCEIMEPATGNHFSSPSCSFHSQFTALLRSPMQRTIWADQLMKTIFPPPLAHFVRNSLPRCAPQCKEQFGLTNL